METSDTQIRKVVQVNYAQQLSAKIEKKSILHV